MYNVKKERGLLVTAMCKIMREYYVESAKLSDDELDGEDHKTFAEMSSHEMVSLVTKHLTLAFECGYKECYDDWVRPYKKAKGN